MKWRRTETLLQLKQLHSLKVILEYTYIEQGHTILKDISNMCVCVSIREGC